MRPTLVALALLFVLSWSPMIARAETAQDLLPGIDGTKLFEVRAWWAGDETKPVPLTAAKLVWRCARLSDQLLSSRATEIESVDELEPLQIANLSGQVRRVRRIRLGDKLADLLEFEHMWLVDLATDKGDVSLLSKEVPSRWSTTKDLDQPTATTGFFLASGTDTTNPLFVVSRLKWFPKQSDGSPRVPRGWTLLSNAGFDASQFDVITEHNRASLSSAESPAFYSLLGATHLIDRKQLTSPKKVGPEDLLLDANAKKVIGEFVRLRVETRRIQRIHDATLLETLGQDHYWEIDAFGELDNVQVQIKSKDGGEPIVFGNRYPVTITLLSLPPFLRPLVEIDGEVRKAMVMHKSMVVVDGFFYRLWSYDTDFVSSRGGEHQIGPLIVATGMQEIEDVGVSNVSLKAMGWVAAAVFMFGLISIVVFTVLSDRGDKAAKKLRHGSLPTELPLASAVEGKE